MTALKKLKFPKNLTFLGEKFWKKDFQLFPKIASQIFFDFDQKRLILIHSFSKLLKKKKKEKTQGFLFSWPKDQNLKWIKVQIDY